LVEDHVSVVVVNWNGKDLLEECLASLEQQTHGPTEIIVVDNNSTDDSIPWLEEAHPRVRIVELTENRGFTGGCNAGIAAAAGSFIALLNTDAVADPRWIESLLAVVRGRPDVGMVASKMVLLRTPTIVDSTGICLDSTGVAWDRRVGESAETVEPREEIFGPCAGAALYRRELFADVGGFDEDFFMYLEDVDLAWRARLAGWRCVYEPAALVYHLHSASAVPNSPFQLFHLARNRVWTIVKNYSTPDLYWYLPAIVLFDVGSSLAALFRPRPGVTTRTAQFATVRGKLAALRQLPVYLSKRRQVQGHRRVPSWRVADELQPIVWLRDPLGFRDQRERSRRANQCPPSSN
jgi:GT2 family glycosyltransferase